MPFTPIPREQLPEDLRGYTSNLPTPKPTPEVSSGVMSFLGGLAKGIAKPIVSPFVQMPRALAAGVAGLAGNEEAKGRFSRPVNLPVLGEIRGLSAAPGDIEKYGTATPMQMTGQAVGLGATLLAPGAKALASPAGIAKFGAKVGGLSSLGASMEEGERDPFSLAFDTLFGVAGGATLGYGGAKLGQYAGKQIAKLRRGQVGDDAVRGIAEVVETPTVDTRTIRERIGKVEPGMPELIRSSRVGAEVLTEEFDDALRIAKEASVNPRAETPLEAVAGRDAMKALKNLKTQLRVLGEEKGREVTAKGAQALGKVKLSEGFERDIPDLIQTFLDDVGSRFGAVVRDVDGVTMLSEAPGRKLRIDRSDARLISDIYKQLGGLGDTATIQQADDVLGAIQKRLYKAENNLAQPADKDVVAYLKSVSGELNDMIKQAAGPKYASSKAEYSDVLDVYNWLNKALGKDTAKGGALMKRVFSPADAGTKAKFEKIRELTGVDLVRSSTFARLAMELAGDVRQKDLLSQLHELGGGQSLKDTLLQKAFSVGRGVIADPEEMIRSVIRREAPLGGRINAEGARMTGITKRAKSLGLDDSGMPVAQPRTPPVAPKSPGTASGMTLTERFPEEAMKLRPAGIEKISNQITSRGKVSVALTDLIDDADPILTEIPEIGNYRVVMNNKYRGKGAMLDTTNEIIYVDPDMGTGERAGLSNVIRHELEHIAQVKQGIQAGGDPSMFTSSPEMVKFALDDVQARALNQKRNFTIDEAIRLQDAIDRATNGEMPAADVLDEFLSDVELNDLYTRLEGEFGARVASKDRYRTNIPEHLRIKQTPADGKTPSRMTGDNTLFHGTAAEFDDFDISRTGQHKSADWGPGVYLTPDQNNARRYAEEASANTGGTPRVKSIKLPSTARMKDIYLGPATQTNQNLSEELITTGYDGARIYNGPRNDPDTFLSEVLVVNPDILKRQ